MISTQTGLRGKELRDPLCERQTAEQPVCPRLAPLRAKQWTRQPPIVEWDMSKENLSPQVNSKQSSDVKSATKVNSTMRPSKRSVISFLMNRAPVKESIIQFA